MATVEVSRPRPALPSRPEVRPSTPQAPPLEFADPKTLSLYGSLTGLYERIVAQQVEGRYPLNRLEATVEIDQVPHLVRTLINGFHLIESDRLSGHPPTTTLLTGVKEVKTEFYHTAQTGQDEALVGLYVFDMSWKNQNNEENPFNQFVVELYANPNGQIIHGIKAFYNDKKESVQKIDMSAADFKRFPLLDRQRALVQGLITLFAPQPPKPQPR